MPSAEAERFFSGDRRELGVLCVAAVLLAGAARAHPADDSSLRVAQNITLCFAAFLSLLRRCIWVSHGVGISFTNLFSPIEERWLPASL